MDYKRRNGGMGGASQAKRGRAAGEWEDSPSQFEEELSMFDDADMDAEEMEGQAGHDVIPVGKLFREKRTFKVKFWPLTYMTTFLSFHFKQIKFYTISITGKSLDELKL